MIPLFSTRVAEGFFFAEELFIVFTVYVFRESSSVCVYAS